MDLDRYIARESPIHAADARLKFIATVAFIVTVSLLPVGSFLALGLAELVVIASRSSRDSGPCGPRAGRSSRRRSCWPRCRWCSRSRATRWGPSTSARSR